MQYSILERVKFYYSRLYSHSQISLNGCSIGDMGKVAMGEVPSLTIYQDRSEMYYLTVLF